MDVGVRELKRRLSELLDRAARGEVIRVTDRGRPKALLGPLLEGPRLDEGIAEGWIRAGAEGPPQPVQRHPSPGTVRVTLTEDRGD